MTVEPTTNVVDLPCIPVIRDGASRVVSLRELLTTAHEITALGDALLPVEREALLRFLESLGAAVLKGSNVIVDSGTPRFPKELVDAFFAKHGALFDLADRDKPLLQEWHTPEPTADDLVKGYTDLKYLHLRVPGASSATWGAIAEDRDPADPAVLLLLLLVSWFHGKASNGAGASFYVPTSGTKRSPISGAPSGGPHDTVFHLLGKNLAETLLLNIPGEWLDGGALPAWLDQDRGPDGRLVPEDATLVPIDSGSTLWRYTWTANRAHVRWEDGRPIAVTRGLTRRAVPAVAQAGPTEGIAGVKAFAKAVATGDYCRVVNPKTSTAKETKYVHATASLRSAEGFERWYRHELSGPMRSWVDKDRVLLPTRDDLLLGFHHEEGDSYGNRELSQWVEVPVDEVTVTGPGRSDLAKVVAHVEAIRKAVGAALLVADINRKSHRPVPIRTAVMASLDAPVLSAVKKLAGGQPIVVEAVQREMTERARATFERATDPLLTLTTAPQIYRARDKFSFLTRVKTPHPPTTEVTPA